MNNYWTKKPLRIYEDMIKRHLNTWCFIQGFVIACKVNNIIEVGGGNISPVKKMVKDYLNIDINKNVEAITGDFTKMDLSNIKTPDLLLASNVIEHCNGYSNFFNQVKKLKPRHTIITFFNGLERDSDIFRIITDGKVGKFYWNKYSMVKIRKKLMELDLIKNDFVKINKDWVLVIR